MYEHRTDRAQRRILVVFLLVIIGLGLFLRLYRLGSPDFNWDETYHYLAAQQLIKGNPPTLPSGYTYNRALLFTDLVAASGRIFGLDEWSARLPSVVFGSLTIVLVAWMGYRWFGPVAGLIAGLLVAVSPLEIGVSRMSRMYAMFEFAFVLSVYLFSIGIDSKPSGMASKAESRAWYRNWGRLTYLEVNAPALILTVPFAILALRLHQLSLVGGLGVASYIFIMTGIRCVSGTDSVGPTLKYAGLSAIVLICAVALWLAYPEFVTAKLKEATYVPNWALAERADWSFYRYKLLIEYPVVFSTIIFAGWLALKRNFNAAMLCGCCLFVPLVIQSLLPWKAARYIVYILPFLFLIFGAGLSDIGSHAARSVGDLFMVHGTSRAYRLAAIGALSIGAIFYLACAPWFADGIRMPWSPKGHNNWRAAVQYVVRRATPDATIIGSSGLLIETYAPRIKNLFQLNNYALDVNQRADWRNDQGDLVDYGSGARLITNLKTLRQVVARGNCVWVVIEAGLFATREAVPEDVAQFIKRNFQSRPVERAPDMLVWRSKDNDRCR